MSPITLGKPDQQAKRNGVKRIMTRLSPVVLIAIVAIFFVQTGHAELPSAKMLAENYRMGQSWQNLCSIHVQRVAPERAFLDPGVRDEQIGNEATILSNGPKNLRWKLQYAIPDTNAASAQRPFDNEYVLTTVGDQLLFLEHVAKDRINGNKTDPESRARVMLGMTAGPLFGIYGDSTKDWLEGLSSLENMSVRQEEVDGVSCYVIEGDSPHGAVKACLDPTKNYALVRYECNVEAGKHLRTDPFTGEDKVFEFTAQAPGKEPRVVKTMRCELVRASFREVEGSFVPEALEVRTTYEYEDGGTWSSNDGYKVTDIDLSPDFGPDAFIPDFPDGTRIWFFQDMLGGFEWQDGAVVHESGSEDLAAAIDGTGGDLITGSVSPKVIDREKVRKALENDTPPIRGSVPFYAALPPYVTFACIAGLVLLAAAVLRRVCFKRSREGR